MGIDKIIKNIKSLFNKNKIKKSHREELKDLLDDLEKKYRKLKSEISSEDSKKTRKKLKIELKIVKVQLRKGREKLESL